MPRIRFSHKPPTSGGDGDNKDRIKFYMTIDLSIPFTMKEKVAIVIILGGGWLLGPDLIRQKILSFFSYLKEATVNLLL